jgi:tetratricopeptide (TPR) repeat protein
MSRSLLAGALVLLSLSAVGQPAFPGVQSRQQYAEALAAARKRNDVPQQAVAALLLGLADVAAHDEVAARTHLEESSRLFVSAGDHFGAWISLLAVAELQKGTLDYDAAIATYDSALGVLTKAALPGEKFSIEHLQGIGGFFGLGQMPMPQGLPQEIFKPILLLFADVVTRDGYGSALMEAGQLTKAETELMRAQQEAAMFGGFFDITLAAHIGDLRRRQWRLDEARAAYAQALRAVSLLPPFAAKDDILRTNLLGEMAGLELVSGRTAEALAWNDQALALARAAKSARREASVMRDRAGLLSRAKRFEAALRTYDEAAALASTAGAHGLHGSILRDVAMLSMIRGKYGTAATQLDDAIRLFQKEGDLDGESSAWSLLSDVYTLMDLRPNAILASEKATELAHRSGARASILGAELTSTARRFFAGLATGADLSETLARVASSPEGLALAMPADDVFSQLMCELTGSTSLSAFPGTEQVTSVMNSTRALLEARTLMQQRRFTDARAVLVRALSTNPGGDFAAGLLVSMGMTWAMEGNFDEAAEALTEAADTVETTLDDLRVEEMLSGYLDSRGVYFELLIHVLLRQGRVREAFEVSERARARALLRLLANSRLEATRGVDAQLVHEAEALRIELADAEQNAITGAPRKRLGQVRERYEALLTRIKTSSPEYASLTEAAPLKLDDIQREIPSGTTLISYFVTKWGVNVWLIDSRGLRFVPLPEGAVAVAEAKCWAERIGSPRGVAAVGTEPPCRADVGPEDVYRALFAPLRASIATRRLLIVAHGPLHYVPFAALRNPETGRYVVEDFTLMYAPSASTLRFLRAKETPVAGHALVFGDPATTGLTGLPHAEEEAAHVAEALNTFPLIGDEAMESRLYALQQEIDLLHIAAHGSYDADHPLFSRIALAPGEGRDGNLEVHEIFGELDLTGVNLVVLAACESGVGKGSAGDDVVGLTRALFYAGTPGVVATLWKVRDDATAEIMNEFYCRLRAGDTAAEALRAAQLAMLHGGRFSAPADWAGVALYGDPLGRWDTSTRSPQAGQ